MAKNVERIRILKMIEEGKITAEEGTRLLGVLAKGNRQKTQPSGAEPRWLRVRVTEIESGRPSVNVNLPIGLVNVGLRMGAKFVPDMEGMDLDDIGEALRQGLTGKIIDIVDEDEGQRVEVYVE
jgi:hypothetical protein